MTTVNPSTSMTMNAVDDPWALYAKALADHAEQIALVVPGRAEISYRQLGDAVEELSRCLSVITETQSSVVVLLGMLPEFVVAELAILHSGMVKVPLNPMLSGTEMAYIAQHSSSTVLLTSSALGAEHQHKIAEIRRENPDLVVLDVSLEGPNSLLDAESASAGPAAVRGHHRAAIYYTGGTTGRPKGVVHSRASVAMNITAHALEAEITSRDVLLLSTSLSHSAGSFAAAGVCRGAQTVLLDRFTPQAFCETATVHQVTFAMVVPTMLYRLLDHAASGAELPPLQTLVYGSAPITPARLEEAIRAFGPILIQLFGQTECPNWGTVLGKRDHARALEAPSILSSCGQRAFFANVAVVDDNGETLGPGQIGEIRLTAPYIMDEYLDNPEATAKTKRDGWIHTGDIGEWDESGYLYVKDRNNDIVITGGYNVYSSEVEAELQKIQGVGQVAVIGIPDPDWGEVVCAVIVPDTSPEAAKLTEESVLAKARDFLGSYKRPKSVQFLKALPLTPFGKADKKILRAPYWAGRERAI
ncbi:AMP-binding protein [Nesterenkonia muleiensis]|uniref:AMP-binding protein n=1 Tax=Nesterenkonia muleiensis TaxID=2282648 RepID=UPI000E7488BB|nr:AMP-binding protein [Nesterenkonia muleiensis]